MFSQFLEFLAILLLVDFLLLSLVRKFKLPDFFGHIATGLFIGLVGKISSTPGGLLALVAVKQNNPAFSAFIQAGLFFFFFELGVRATFQLYKENSFRDFRALVLNSVSVFVFAISVAVLMKNIGLSTVQIIFLPIAFLSADIGGLVTSHVFNPGKLQSKYFDFIKFSAAQEFIALGALLIFVLATRVTVGQIDFSQILLMILGSALFTMLILPSGQKFRQTYLKGFPLFLIIISILLILVSVLWSLQLSILLCGFLAGLALQCLLSRNQYSGDGLPMSVFRFFMVFPFISIGISLTGGFNWALVNLNLLLILFILITTAFVMGLFWMRYKKDFLTPTLALLFRGEVTLLILYWGFFQQLVRIELLTATVLIMFVFHFLSRLGILNKIQQETTAN